MTPKQTRFVEEYLVDLNATQAAIRAGFSEKTAKTQGSRMLTNVDIQKAIETAAQERTERTEITQDWVLERLKIEAEFHGKGATHGGRVQALTQLGKYFSLFTEKFERTGLTFEEALAQLDDFEETSPN